MSTGREVVTMAKPRLRKLLPALGTPWQRGEATNPPWRRHDLGPQDQPAEPHDDARGGQRS